MLELGITLLISAIVVIAVVYIVSIWIYKRAPANMGFIRTGFGGTKVCLGRGAIVLPVFHEVSWISLETIKLIVSRSRDQAILTSDNIRVDVVAELYAHVGHTEDDLLTASRSLGEKTFDADKVRDLLEAKVVSTLRSYAATKTLNELHENRDTFAKDIKASVVESFQANGLALEEVTIVTLEQTAKEHFNRDNVFDAEGLRIITEITSKARREVHDTEKRTIVSLRQKDLDTQLELLEIERQEAFARAGQDKDISNEEALQVGRKQIFVLDQQKAVEEKEIENELELERKRTEREISITEEGQRREASEIRKALALEQERRDKEIAIIAKAKEEELAEIARGLSPADIDLTVMTHAHWDHAENFDLFDHAPMLIHSDELKYARKPHRNDWATPRWTAAMIDFQSRVQEVEEGYEIEPGIRIMHAPGHSPGSMVVIVDTDNGVAAVTGDVLHYATVALSRVNPLVFWSREQATRSIDRILETADSIYPGHDRPFRLVKGEVDYMAPRHMALAGIQPGEPGIEFDASPRQPWVMPGIEEQTLG